MTTKKLASFINAEDNVVAHTERGFNAVTSIRARPSVQW